jgi:hypothetical protein
VDGLNTILCAGQLSTAARNTIVTFVSNTNNFGYSNPPTGPQMRDRIRAVTHLMTDSPDFVIQK